MKQLIILAILLLAACTTRPPQPGGNGLEISGSVEIASNVIGSTSSPERKGLDYSHLDFVPGEVIVRFKPTVALQGVSGLSVGGVSLQKVSSSGIPNTYLYKAPADRAGTLELIKALESRPDVLWAEPNGFATVKAGT